VAEAMAAGYLTAGIEELARLAGCSPQHLSRVFRRVHRALVVRPARRQTVVEAALRLGRHEVFPHQESRSSPCPNL